MNAKRGQVTIFVIIAIIIVAAIAGFFLLKDGDFVSPSVVPDEISGVNDFVIDCIEQKSYEALYIVGQQGGYAFPPSNALTEDIPIYLDRGVEDVPTLEQIGGEIETYINDDLGYCLGIFEDFLDLIITADEDLVSSSVTISQEKVMIDVSYPITIESETSTYSLENFNNIEIPVRLGFMYNTMVEIIDAQKDFDAVCLSCLSEIQERSGLDMNFYNYVSEDGLVTIFDLTDTRTTIEGEDYVFLFAIKNELGAE